MIVFIFIAYLATNVFAIPDVSLTNNPYLYNGPRMPENVNFLSTNLMQQQQQQQQQDLPTPQQATNFQSHTPYTQQSNNIGPQIHMQPPHMTFSEDTYKAAYQYSNIPQQGGYAASKPQTSVHKHVYVHIPPKGFEDEDAIQPHVYHQTGPKQKNYKIVFIKAPTQPAAKPPVVAPPPQNEEKTLIYVLHKKPETHQEIVIPTPAPTTPSKPEVFFIKYKNKQQEAPVYGAPPSLYGEPRHANEPNAGVGEDSTIPTTTLQPQVDMSEIYGAPTAPTNAEMLPTASSAQYLPPNEGTQQPIIVDEVPNMVHSQYGPPNKFFFKQK